MITQNFELLKYFTKCFMKILIEVEPKFGILTLPGLFSFEALDSWPVSIQKKAYKHLYCDLLTFTSDLNKEQLQELDYKLHNIFGLSTKNFKHKLLKSIISKNKINNDEEYYFAVEMINNTENIDLIFYNELNDLVVTYESIKK